jgi:hypothetical protein
VSAVIFSLRYCYSLFLSFCYWESKPARRGASVVCACVRLEGGGRGRRLHAPRAIAIAIEAAAPRRHGSMAGGKRQKGALASDCVHDGRPETDRRGDVGGGGGGDGQELLAIGLAVSDSVSFVVGCSALCAALGLGICILISAPCVYLCTLCRFVSV